MNKKIKTLDLTSKKPLIERQRRLWSHAEAIQVAQEAGRPLPVDVSEWLHRALRNIACGEDANAVFDVVPEKRGVRKNALLLALQKEIANGYIAAAVEPTSSGSRSKKTSVAITEISEAIPGKQRSTVRKNWNSVSTARKPTFTLGKK
jgi:hypothetical protein